MIAREMVVSATRKSSEEEFLESVPRLHSFRVDASGVTVNNYSNAWLRMLQTIPGVSEDKAQSLMDHFPTFESLMRAYRDSTLTQTDKEDLLTDKLHRMRFERALSKRIYSIFTSMDPTASVP
jgi:ERCC4-type nuclease